MTTSQSLRKLAEALEIVREVLQEKEAENITFDARIDYITDHLVIKAYHEHEHYGCAYAITRKSASDANLKSQTSAAIDQMYNLMLKKPVPPEWYVKECKYEILHYLPRK